MASMTMTNVLSLGDLVILLLVIAVLIAFALFLYIIEGGLKRREPISQSLLFFRRWEGRLLFGSFISILMAILLEDVNRIWWSLAYFLAFAFLPPIIHLLRGLLNR
jgi:hypothetical protein